MKSEQFTEDGVQGLNRIAQAAHTPNRRQRLKVALSQNALRRAAKARHTLKLAQAQVVQLELREFELYISAGADRLVD